MERRSMRALLARREIERDAQLARGLRSQVEAGERGEAPPPVRIPQVSQVGQRRGSLQSESSRPAKKKRKETSPSRRSGPVVSSAGPTSPTPARSAEQPARKKTLLTDSSLCRSLFDSAPLDDELYKELSDRNLDYLEYMKITSVRFQYMVKGLSDQHSQMTEELAELESTREKLVEEKGRLENDAASFEAMRSGMEARLMELTGEVSDLKGKLGKSEEERERLLGELRRTKRRIAELEGRPTEEETVEKYKRSAEFNDLLLSECGKTFGEVQDFFKRVLKRMSPDLDFGELERLLVVVAEEEEGEGGEVQQSRPETPGADLPEPEQGPLPEAPEVMVEPGYEPVQEPEAAAEAEPPLSGLLDGRAFLDPPAY